MMEYENKKAKYIFTWKQYKKNTQSFEDNLDPKRH